MAVKSLARSSIRQSSKVNSALAGYESNYFHHLETVRLGGNAASVTFSNLSRYSDYQHLQIRIAARSTNASNEDFHYIQFNGDTGANYRHHYLVGTGSSVLSGDATSTYPNGILDYFAMTASTSVANAFGVSIIDILDPFDSFKNTTTRTISGFAGSYNRIGVQSGVWLNTSAVTQVTLDAVFASYAQSSRFSLYGLKARA